MRLRIILPLAAVAACGPIGGTGHDVAPSAVVPDPAGSSRYEETLDGAVDNLCLAAADDPRFTGPERRLLQSLTGIYGGNTAAAMSDLARFVEEGHTGRLQAQAVSGLAALYEGSSRWTALAELVERHGDEAENPSEIQQNATLAREFAGQPPETYEFAGASAQVRTSVNRFGQPMLEVRANGHKREYLLDTGASLSVLTRSEVERIGATELGEEAALGQTATNIKVEVLPGLLQELQLGELTIRNHPIGVVEDDVLEVKLAGVTILDLDGIVGWPLFQEVRVEIDYAGGETVLRPFEDFAETGRAPRNLFWLGYPIVIAAGGDGTPLFFGFDTGAAGTSINTHVITKTGARVQSGGRGMLLGAGGGEAVQKRKVHDFVFHLAGRRYEFPEIGVADGAKSAVLVEPDGMLGSDLLQGARVIVDLAEGVFAVER